MCPLVVSESVQFNLLVGCESSSHSFKLLLLLKHRMNVVDWFPDRNVWMNVCWIRYYYFLCIAVLGKIRFKKKKMMMNGISRERKGRKPCRKHNTDRKVFDVASRQCEQQVENNYVNTLLNAIGTPSSQIRFMAHCHLVYRLNCRKNVRSWAAQYFCSCLCSSVMLFSWGWWAAKNISELRLYFFVNAQQPVDFHTIRAYRSHINCSIDSSFCDVFFVLFFCSQTIECIKCSTYFTPNRI